MALQTAGSWPGYFRSHGKSTKTQDKELSEAIGLQAQERHDAGGAFEGDRSDKAYLIRTGSEWLTANGFTLFR